MSLRRGSMTHKAKRINQATGAISSGDDMMDINKYQTNIPLNAKEKNELLRL
jgi:hypothetical protein